MKRTNRESINKSRVVTQDCIEKAVKKIEFGKVNSRTNIYMREEITGSKTQINSALNKKEKTLSKMKLAKNESDVSLALSDISGKM